MPFSLTESASKRVKETLIKQNHWYIRIKVVLGGCSGLNYVIEFADAVDEKMDACINLPDDIYFGVAIVIDKKSLIYLADVTLDYVAGLTSSSFKFINPKATHTCGCGESFSV
ncbi:MAG: iron-sulfur cluster assembly accessory protein [bacterium]|nr:iron-sulfur cluster assembly accessory protein [bacterium]